MATVLEKLKEQYVYLCRIRDELENDLLEQMRTLENDDTYQKYIKVITHIQDSIFHLRDTIIAVRKM